MKEEGKSWDEITEKIVGSTKWSIQVSVAKKACVSDTETICQ